MIFTTCSIFCPLRCCWINCCHFCASWRRGFTSIITRGLAETARLGECLGADPLTFAGLAGLGDLVATCSSPLSRNRSFGERLGKGESLDQAQEATHGQVAEGVKSCRSVLELAQHHDVDVPITQAVEAVCFRGLTPQRMLEMLMSRQMKSETGD